MLVSTSPRGREESAKDAEGEVGSERMQETSTEIHASALRYVGQRQAHTKKSNTNTSQAGGGGEKGRGGMRSRSRC